MLFRSLRGAQRRLDAVRRLVRIANLLDDMDMRSEASMADAVMRHIAEEEPEAFAKHPKLKVFVDNIVRTRGGHVSVPAILKMLRDERPEDINTTDPKLLQYIEQRIKADKQEVNDGGDEIAGAGVGLSTTWEERNEENRMFEPPKPATM